MMNCQQCSYVAFSKSALSRHINSSHVENKEKCAECDVELPKTSLKLHVKRVHNRCKIDCTKCNYSCSSSTNMKRHIQLVHLKKTEKCPKCNIVLKLGSVKRHIQQVHMNINSISCPVCPYSTSKRTNLQNHIQAVHFKMKETCVKCGKQVNMGGLATHVKRVHLKIRKYKCSFCTHSTATTQEMSGHVKMVHMKEKENCKLCSAKLSNKQSLKRHLRLVHKTEQFKIRKQKKGKHELQVNLKKPKSRKMNDKEYMDILWDSIPDEKIEEDVKNEPQSSKTHCPVKDCQSSFYSLDDINDHLMSEHVLE